MSEDLDLLGTVRVAKTVVRNTGLPMLTNLLAAVDASHPDHNTGAGLHDIVDVRPARQHIRGIARGFRLISMNLMRAADHADMNDLVKHARKLQMPILITDDTGNTIMTNQAAPDDLDEFEDWNELEEF
jgi:hypothetical protein